MAFQMRNITDSIILTKTEQSIILAVLIARRNAEAQAIAQTTHGGDLVLKEKLDLIIDVIQMQRKGK